MTESAGEPPAAEPYPGQPYPGQPYPGQPYPGQPYPGQPYPAYPAAPTTDQNAVWALVCAIGSWVLLPVALAVVALFLAAAAERSIGESNGWRTGSGMVTAAKVLAWLNLVAAVLVVVFVVALVVGLAAGT